MSRDDRPPGVPRPGQRYPLHARRRAAEAGVSPGL